MTAGAAPSGHAVTEPPPAPARRWLAWAALGVVYVLWGSTFLAIRVGVRHLPPATFAGSRYLLAGLLLYPIAWRSGAREVRARDRPGRRQWASCAVIGMLLLVLGNGGVTIAEQHLDSGIAAVLVASIPLWMIVFAAIWTRRAPSPIELAGLVCGLLGVGVLAAGSGSGGDGGAVAIVLIGASGWAFGSVLAGRLPLPERVLLGSAMQMIAGGVLLLAAGAVRGEYPHVHLSDAVPSTWFAFGWLVVPAGMLAFTAYGYALSNLPLPTVATYAYVNPVIAVLLGVVVLGERLAATELAGMGIVLVSVAVTVSRRGSAKAAP